MLLEQAFLTFSKKLKPKKPGFQAKTHRTSRNTVQHLLVQRYGRMKLRMLDPSFEVAM